MNNIIHKNQADLSGFRRSSSGIADEYAGKTLP